MLAVVIGVVLGLVLTQLVGVATTVYLHRTLAHRAMKVSPAVAVVCRVLLWMLSGIRPRQWVAVHRKHHAFTDVPGDPHSPRLLGFATVQLANVALYRKVARDRAVVARYARDIPADRFDRLLFDHAWMGTGLAIALVWLGLGWEVMLIAALVHAATYMMLNSAVNAVGHRFGHRPYPNTAGNSQWLAWITAGEGLHNNHHAAPSSARLSHRRAEIDPGWWTVALLSRLGLAKVRHLEIRTRKVRAAG